METVIAQNISEPIHFNYLIEDYRHDYRKRSLPRYR